MSQKKLWMLAAIRPLVLTIVFCGATVGLTACDKANAQNDNPASAVKSEELIRTSQSWDGVMKWTALRMREDGTTYTAKFQMTKVK